MLLRGMIILLATLSLPLFADNAHDAIATEMKQIIQKIDSKERGVQLQDYEYTVALFQQILGRDPNHIELNTVTGLLYGDYCERSDTGKSCVVKISRSQLLAKLLLKKENASQLTYQIVAKNLPAIRKLDLQTVPTWKTVFPTITDQETQKNNKEELRLPLQANDDEYQAYFGNLHSHTSFSDGSGTPDEAYTVARDVGKLDFFAVTDHAEMLAIWPWEDKWAELKEIALSFNEDHKFVALHGFEWSSPIFGHINIINSDKTANAVSHLLVKDIFKWLAKRPHLVARFNHPGRDKLGVEFDHFKLYPEVVDQVVAVEMFSKSKKIKEFFFSKGYTQKYNNHLDDALHQGWNLGVVGGQDNHDKDWGIRNDFLVGVWATELTREAIIDAYRSRRTFATEDRNMSISIKMNGQEMGSRMLPGAKTLEVAVYDGDQEPLDRIEVYKSGQLWKTYPAEEYSAKVSVQVQAQTGEYYYAVAIQKDDSWALTSPIWIQEE
jgi:hypothetical protein